MGKTKQGKSTKKSKYRKKRNSESSSSSSSSSFSSIDEETKRKLKKKIKKLKKKEKRKKKEKKALKQLAKAKLNKELKAKVKQPVIENTNSESGNYDVNLSLMEKSKSLAPMTKEEWEKQQSVLRRVYDEETGRTRLIKGTGEIVEECVSRERHLAINKQATRGDGEHFQKVLTHKLN